MQKIIVIVIIFLVWAIPSVSCADELEEIVDFESIQEVIDKTDTGTMEISFFDIINQLLGGEGIVGDGSFIETITESFFKEIRSTAGNFRELIIIVVIAAIFANISTSLKNGQVAETGFYVVYIVLFAVLINSFQSSMEVAEGVLRSIMDFVQVLVPSFCIAVAIGVGSGTSAVLYQGILLLISVIEIILLKVALPGITLYMLLAVMGNISKENVISRLTGLIETLIKWVLKTIPGLVFGIGTVQGMLMPVIDDVKRTAAVKGLSALPGVGNIFNSAGETVLGTGILLKNSIGMAGTVVMFLIALLPLIKLLVYVLVFRMTGAVIQPVADTRVIQGVDAVANAVSLLLKTVFSGIMSFAIAIVIVVMYNGSV